ncbi:MAG TPA: CotH kinase family protein [Kofleriaceae bacterium]|nr:CotH kinase family protein [Kofleriaceae bacterium]
MSCRGLLLVLLAVACDPGAPGGGDAGDPTVDGGSPDPYGCSPVFDAALLPDYRVTISAREYDAMWDEFVNWEAREAAGLERNPYHPIQFQWQDSNEIDAMIRLKGSTSWKYAVELDDPPKMQFVISFNEVDPEARFMGLRKIELDMPRNDRTYLRQRLALAALRELGVPAECSNSARLFINGDYYGLYAALEREDKEFLQRIWPGADEGVLLEAGRDPEANDENMDQSRVDLLWAVQSADDMTAMIDVDQTLREWAGEALVNNFDGYYGGHPNYFVYDHPHNGFTWVPHDLDATWDYGDVTLSPVYPVRDRNVALHYRLVMNDPVWVERYLDDLAELHASMDVHAQQERVDDWTAQIREAAETDPNRPFTVELYRQETARLRQSIADHCDFLDAWFACHAAGTGADADGDGVPFCAECDDHDPDSFPGADEDCNQLDDDCDGLIDEGC